MLVNPDKAGGRAGCWNIHGKFSLYLYFDRNVIISWQFRRSKNSADSELCWSSILKALIFSFSVEIESQGKSCMRSGSGHCRESCDTVNQSPVWTLNRKHYHYASCRYNRSGVGFMLCECRHSWNANRVGKLIDRLFDWLIDWSNWLTDWLIDWSIKLTYWLIDWLIDWSNWLIDWLIDWLDHHSFVPHLPLFSYGCSFLCVVWMPEARHWSHSANSCLFPLLDLFLSLTLAEKSRPFPFGKSLPQYRSLPLVKTIHADLFESFPFFRFRHYVILTTMFFAQSLGTHRLHNQICHTCPNFRLGVRSWNHNRLSFQQTIWRCPIRSPCLFIWLLNRWVCSEVFDTAKAAANDYSFTNHTTPHTHHQPAHHTICSSRTTLYCILITNHTTPYTDHQPHHTIYWSPTTPHHILITNHTILYSDQFLRYIVYWSPTTLHCIVITNCTHYLWWFTVASVYSTLVWVVEWCFFLFYRAHW